MAARERIVVIETFDERELPVREPGTELELYDRTREHRPELLAELRAEPEYVPPARARAA